MVVVPRTHRAKILDNLCNNVLGLQRPGLVWSLRLAVLRTVPTKPLSQTSPGQMGQRDKRDKRDTGQDRWTVAGGQWCRDGHYLVEKLLQDKWDNGTSGTSGTRDKKRGSVEARIRIRAIIFVPAGLVKFMNIDRFRRAVMRKALS